MHFHECWKIWSWITQYLPQLRIDFKSYVTSILGSLKNGFMSNYGINWLVIYVNASYKLIQKDFIFIYLFNV